MPFPRGDCGTLDFPTEHMMSTKTYLTVENTTQSSLKVAVN